MSKSTNKGTDWGTRCLKFFASLKMAIFIIIVLGILSAVGTFYEALYDAKTAQKLVYHSVYMNAMLLLLCLTLVAVMIDRWPWKQHHAGFVLAHIGIIIMLFGALLTQKLGIDGSLSFGIGEKGRFIVLPDEEINVLAHYQGTSPELLHNEVVEFIKSPPTPDDTFKIHFSDKTLEVIDYYQFAQVSERIVRSNDASRGPALRFQLQNERVSLAEWISKPLSRTHTSVSLGPAKVIMSDGSYDYEGGNVIVLEPQADSEKLKYFIYTESQSGLVSSGTAEAGDVVQTGWMGLNLRFLTYFPRSERKITYTKLKRPTPISTSAIKIRLGDSVEWLGLNETVRLFNSNSAYIISYRNRLLPLTFDMRLKKFNVGRYQGTLRASSYASEVEVEGIGSQVISMNNPLKFQGYTFYQSSFSEDEAGQPTASILSVNHDPGRFWKYLGSILLVLGTMILFYFKRVQWFAVGKRSN